MNTIDQLTFDTCTYDVDGSDIVPELEPDDNTVVPSSHKNLSGFWTNDVPAQSTKRGVYTVVLAGMYASLCVESVRDAVENGYVAPRGERRDRRTELGHARRRPDRLRVDRPRDGPDRRRRDPIVDGLGSPGERSSLPSHPEQRRDRPPHQCAGDRADAVDQRVERTRRAVGHQALQELDAGPVHRGCGDGHEQRPLVGGQASVSDGASQRGVGGEVEVDGRLDAEQRRGSGVARFHKRGIEDEYRTGEHDSVAERPRSNRQGTGHAGF